MGGSSYIASQPKGKNVECSAVQCSAVQCSAVQCCAGKKSQMGGETGLPVSDGAVRMRARPVPVAGLGEQTLSVIGIIQCLIFLHWRSQLLTLEILTLAKRTRDRPPTETGTLAFGTNSSPECRLNSRGTAEFLRIGNCLTSVSARGRIMQRGCEMPGADTVKCRYSEMPIYT
jgi:hypothetical protein